MPVQPFFQNLDFTEADTVFAMAGDSLSADNAAIRAWTVAAESFYAQQGRKIRFVNIAIDGGDYFGMHCDPPEGWELIQVGQRVAVENARRENTPRAPLNFRVGIALGTNDRLLQTRGRTQAQAIQDAANILDKKTGDIRVYLPGVPVTYIEQQLLSRFLPDGVTPDPRQQVQDYYALSDAVKQMLVPGLDNWFSLPTYRFRARGMLLKDGIPNGPFAAVGQVAALGLTNIHQNPVAQLLAGAMFVERMATGGVNGAPIPGFDYQSQPYRPWGSAFGLLDDAEAGGAGYQAWLTSFMPPF